MRKAGKVILLSVFIFAGLQGFTQDMKIGYIKTQQILQQMPARKEAEKKFKQYQKNLQRQMEQLQVEYNKKTKELKEKSQDTSTSDAVIQELSTQLQNMQKRMRKRQQSVQQQMQKKRQQLFQPVNKKLQNALKEIGKEKGYLLIVPANSVHYYSKTKCENVMPYVKEKLGIADN